MKRYKVLANSISLPVSKRPTRIYSKGDETEIADDVAGPLLKQKAIELIKEPKEEPAKATEAPKDTGGKDATEGGRK